MQKASGPTTSSEAMLDSLYDMVELALQQDEPSSQEMSESEHQLQQQHCKSMEISKQQVLLFHRIGTISKQVLSEHLRCMDTTVSVQEIVVVSVMEHDELYLIPDDLLV